MNVFARIFSGGTSLQFEIRIENKPFVWILGQEHMCSYVVWLSHIQSVLGHYIEVEGFLCSFLVDDVAFYLVAVGLLSIFVTSICITFYESEQWVVCLENPWCSFGVDVLQCNLRTALWLTIIYLVAPISLVGIRKYHFC